MFASHTRQLKTLIQCDVCFKFFPNAATLAKHQAAEHQGENRPGSRPLIFHPCRPRGDTRSSTLCSELSPPHPSSRRSGRSTLSLLHGRAGQTGGAPGAHRQPAPERRSAGLPALLRRLSLTRRAAGAPAVCTRGAGGWRGAAWQLPHGENLRNINSLSTNGLKFAFR